MDALKRVFWKVGQPLLPKHLVAQEDSLLAYTRLSLRYLGLPFYGIGALQWDDTLLVQGIVSITEMMVLFPSGQLVHAPGNGEIPSFDLNKTGKNRVEIYLHLLSSLNEEEDYLDSSIEREKIVYSIHQMELSDDHNAPSIAAAMKLGEFEKNLENQWRVCEEYIPPLLSLRGNPFSKKIFMELKTKLEQFQNSIEMVSHEKRHSEGQTLETNLCLLEIAKVRRLLLNMEHQVATHPYHLYASLSEYLDTIALLYNNKTNFKLIPYQHEKLGPLFQTMLEAFNLDAIVDQEISQLEFEKKDKCYVSSKLPQDLNDAKEVYFILQKIDTTGSPNIEGLKLSAYSRLMNTVIFSTQGIPIVRIERAPFNHNFSKRANIYTVEKGLEWNHALKEGRLAFAINNMATQDVQAFLYWR